MNRTLPLALGLAIGLNAAPTSVPAADGMNAAAVNDRIAAVQSGLLASAALPVGLPPIAFSPAPPAPLPIRLFPSSTARPSLPADNVQPDFAFTPGRVCTPSDPNFQEYRYAEHIPYCRRNVTQQMKQEIAAHYGIPQSDWPNYEFDHLIPLAVGGDSSVDNLWPQPIGQAKVKDVLENQLFLEMQAGTITQAEAMRQIYAWFGVSNPASPVKPHPIGNHTR